MAEGVAKACPATMDIEEGLDLQHGGDARILSVLEAGVEQPAIDGLTFLGAGLDGLTPGGVGLGDQVADQPEFQRVHAGDVAAVRQVVGVRTVALVEAGDLLAADVATVETIAEEGVEGVRRGVGREVAEGGGKAVRRLAQAAEEGFLDFSRGLAAVFVPEAAQENLAFLIGEAGEIFGAARVAGLLQQLRTAARHLEHGVAHHVAHQPHEGQVDRGLQGFAYCRHAAVVFLAEVVEAMDAAASEEVFGRAGRVAACQRRLQHRRQLGFLVGNQVIDRPAADVVARFDAQLAQFVGGLGCMALVQFGDDFKIGRQHAQLGGRAEFELASFVDVERLVGGVGLHADAVAVRRAFDQIEAVAYGAQAVGGQHALAEQAVTPGNFRVRETFEIVGDAAL